MVYLKWATHPRRVCRLSEDIGGQGRRHNGGGGRRRGTKYTHAYTIHIQYNISYRNPIGINPTNQTTTIGKFPIGFNPTNFLYKSFESNMPLLISRGMATARATTRVVWARATARQTRGAHRW